MRCFASVVCGEKGESRYFGKHAPRSSRRRVFALRGSDEPLQWRNNKVAL